jgi:hypothetical protein
MGIQLPNQIPVNCQWVPMESAAPVSTVISGQMGVQVTLFGGYSKLEQGALMVAAGMMQRIGEHAPITGNDDELAARAVTVAEAVLNAARAREKQLRGA